MAIEKKKYLPLSTLLIIQQWLFVQRTILTGDIYVSIISEMIVKIIKRTNGKWDIWVYYCCVTLSKGCHDDVSELGSSWHNSVWSLDWKYTFFSVNCKPFEYFLLQNTLGSYLTLQEGASGMDIKKGGGL